MKKNLQLKYIGVVDESIFNYFWILDDPRNLLSINQYYKVLDIYFNDWHSIVILKDFPHRIFDSSWFEEFKTNKNI